MATETRKIKELKVRTAPNPNWISWATGTKADLSEHAATETDRLCKKQGINLPNDDLVVLEIDLSKRGHAILGPREYRLDDITEEYEKDED